MCLSLTIGSVFFSQLELLNQLGKWSQLLFLDQLKLIDKKYKVLKACVQVILKPQRQNDLKVSVVNMCIDSEKALEYSLDHRHKVFGEGDT